MNVRRIVGLLGGSLLLAGGAAAAQPAYTVTAYRPPEGLKFEVTGIAQLPDGRVGLALRKGEVWLLERPQADPNDPQALGYRRIASGLHEPIGLLWHAGALHTMQRAELTRLRDRNGDDVIDDYETVAQGWGVSGAYHEYGYGPVADGAGNLWLTLNSTMGPAAKMPGHRPPDNPWRGWAMRISPAGVMEPVCAGFRSPSGLGTNAAGDVFATDQQGNFWGTNPVLHLRPGAFFGHKASIPDTRRAEARVGDPGVLEEELTVAEVAKRNPRYTLPAVWLPYPEIGQSATGIACDRSGGKFGPFAEQLFIGEFTLSRVTRVFLEQVGGEYQGAAFRFVDGLKSGPVSMGFLADGSLLAGETNRGWNSAGTRSYGLERIRWTGVVPFEVRTMRAQPDGFVLEFTAPVDVATAMNPASYEGSSYTYIYQRKYGSPEVETQPFSVTRIEVLPDGRTVRLRCAGLRERYVHELSVAGVRSAGGEAVVNPVAYYTLNRIPAR